MKKMIVLLLLFSTSAFAAEWYEEGSLHDKRVNEWKQATYANRLATSADFVAYIFGEERVGRMGSMDALKPYVVQMMTCIDEGTKGDNIPNMQVSEVAASCTVIMGWR